MGASFSVSLLIRPLSTQAGSVFGVLDTVPNRLLDVQRLRCLVFGQDVLLGAGFGPLEAGQLNGLAILVLRPPAFATLDRTAESLAEARIRPGAPGASKSRALMLVGARHQSREHLDDQWSDLRQAGAYDGDVHFDGRPHGGGDVVRLIGRFGLVVNGGDSEA